MSDEVLYHECIICFEHVNINEISTPIFQNCKHNSYYHNDCIQQWLHRCQTQYQPLSCPICRHELIVDIPEELIIMDYHYPRTNQSHVCSPILCCCMLIFAIIGIIEINMNTQ